MSKPVARSKAYVLHDRLITREKHQLVNPKVFGTANSRNERQLEKKMQSLRTQQAKRLAKIADEMDEVKTLQKILKEVETDTSRDPRTTDERRTTEKTEGSERSRGELGRQRFDDLFGSRTLQIKRHTPVGGHGLSRSMEALVSVKPNRPQCSTTHVARTKNNGLPSLSPRREDGNGLNFSPMQANQKSTILGGLLDIQVKRDLSFLNRYSYNQKSDNKLLRERRQPNMLGTKQTGKVLRASYNTRENHSMNGKHGVKNNIQTTGPEGGRRRSESFPKAANEETLYHGHGIYVLANQVAFNESRAANHERRKVNYRVHNFTKSGNEDAPSPSDDDGQNGYLPEPSENNWDVTLRKCRYLRKPKGYETPEMPIEAVFQ